MMTVMDIFELLCAKYFAKPLTFNPHSILAKIIPELDTL